MDSKGTQEPRGSTAAAGRFADQVEISINPIKRGIELRFNASLHQELKPKLRAKGFKPGKLQTFWTASNTPESLAFAEEVKAELAGAPWGPALLIAPSYPPSKANIDKKEFSFVTITLQSGEEKKYILFEASKPSAEVIALNFAKAEFGSDYKDLAVEPRLHIKEARMLFDDGRIIAGVSAKPHAQTEQKAAPISENKPVNTEDPAINSSSNTSEPFMEQSTSTGGEKPFLPSGKIPITEISLTTEISNELYPLYLKGQRFTSFHDTDAFIKSLVGNHSDVYFRIHWQDASYHEGAFDLEPSEDYRRGENLLATRLLTWLTNVSKAQAGELCSRRDIAVARLRLEKYQLQDEPLVKATPKEYREVPESIDKAIAQERKIPLRAIYLTPQTDLNTLYPDWSSADVFHSFIDTDRKFQDLIGKFKEVFYKIRWDDEMMILGKIDLVPKALLAGRENILSRHLYEVISEQSKHMVGNTFPSAEGERAARLFLHYQLKDEGKRFSYQRAFPSEPKEQEDYANRFREWLLQRSGPNLFGFRNQELDAFNEINGIVFSEKDEETFNKIFYLGSKPKAVSAGDSFTPGGGGKTDPNLTTEYLFSKPVFDKNTYTAVETLVPGIMPVLQACNAGSHSQFIAYAQRGEKKVYFWIERKSDKECQVAFEDYQGDKKQLRVQVLINLEKMEAGINSEMLSPAYRERYNRNTDNMALLKDTGDMSRAFREWVQKQAAEGITIRLPHELPKSLFSKANATPTPAPRASGQTQLQNDLDRYSEFLQWALTKKEAIDEKNLVKPEALDWWIRETGRQMSAEERERLWKRHETMTKSVKRMRKFSEPPRMEPYSGNYKRLLRIIPNLIQHLENGTDGGRSVIDPDGGMMDLNFDYLHKNKDGSYVIALSHYHRQAGDSLADPDMELRVDPELQIVEALTFQQDGVPPIYNEVYVTRDGQKMVNLKAKKDLNSFLRTWLLNLIHQGHRIDLSKEEEEDNTPERETLEENTEAKLEKEFEQGSEFGLKTYDTLLEAAPDLRAFIDKPGKQQGESLGTMNLEEHSYDLLFWKQDFQYLAFRIVERIGDLELNETAVLLDTAIKSAKVLYRNAKGIRLGATFPDNATELLLNWLQSALAQGKAFDNAAPQSPSLVRQNLFTRTYHLLTQVFPKLTAFLAGNQPASTSGRIDEFNISRHRYALAFNNKRGQSFDLVLFDYLDGKVVYEAGIYAQRQHKQAWLTYHYKQAESPDGNLPVNTNETLCSWLKDVTSRDHDSEHAAAPFNAAVMGKFLESDLYLLQMWSLQHKDDRPGDEPISQDKAEHLEAFYNIYVVQDRAMAAQYKALCDRMAQKGISSPVKTTDCVNTGNQATAKITDTHSRTVRIPNVLVPAGIEEPFIGNDFELFDMKKVFQQCESLTKLTDTDLAKASPGELFQFMQLRDPSGYGLNVSAAAIGRTWRANGGTLFAQLGYPTDKLYPYVNIKKGYETVRAFGEILSSIDHEKAHWDILISRYRPVANLPATLELLDTEITNRESGLSKCNQKGRLSWEELEEVNSLGDLDNTLQASIDNLRESISVIKNYLQTQGATPKVPSTLSAKQESPGLDSATKDPGPEIEYITSFGVAYFNPYIMARFILKSNSLLYSMYGSRFSRKNLEGRAFMQEEVLYLKNLFAQNIPAHPEDFEMYNELYNREPNRSYTVEESQAISEHAMKKHVRDLWGMIYTLPEREGIRESFAETGLSMQMNGQQAYEQNVPVIKLVQRWDEICAEYQEKINGPAQQAIKSYKSQVRKLKGDKSNRAKVKELEGLILQKENECGRAMQLLEEEYLVFQDEVFEQVCAFARRYGIDLQSLVNKTSFDIGGFRDEILQGLMDGRTMENYFKEPVQQVTGNFLKKYFEEDPALSKLVSSTQLATVGTKAIVENIKMGEIALPNVLVPASIQEPFVSREFESYAVPVAEHFAELGKFPVNKLAGISATRLYELMTLQHPDSFGIGLSHTDVSDELERRGEKVFGELGLPVDRAHPFVNIHLGYQKVKPLAYVLAGYRQNGKAWWSAIQDWLPVADANTGLEIIAKMLESAQRKKASLADSKGGKAKEGMANAYQDAAREVQYLQESEKVLHDFINGRTALDANNQQAMKAIAKDLQTRNGLLPNVLIPAGVREPLASGNFYAGDKSVKGFKDLKALTKKTIRNASAVQQFEVMQFDHPNENGIPISRSEMLRLFEEKGEQIFRDLGYPTEPAYPYVNVSLGYKALYPLVGLLGDEKHDKNHWWHVAEHWRPVADMDKALVIIDQLIEKAEASMKALVNPKSGKPKGKSKSDANSLQYDLRELQKNRQTVVDYIQILQDKGKSAPLISTLRSAYWSEHDADGGEMENKIILNAAPFHKFRLVDELLLLTSKLSLSAQLQLAADLAGKFGLKAPKHAPADERAEQSEAIQEFIEKLVEQKDFALLGQQKNYPVLEFLIAVLCKDAEQLVDQPQEKEEVKAVPQVPAEQVASKPGTLEHNRAIEAFIKEKDAAKQTYTEQDKQYISTYAGSGGLSQQGAEDRGILYEFYTPDPIVQKMWGLALQFGYEKGRILEPAAGTGNFLKYVPKGQFAVAYETNPIAARIAKILYPEFMVINEPFESTFFNGNIHLKDNIEAVDRGYALVIGNPPYGEFHGKYAGMGEKKWVGANMYEQYFILRGLDLLKSGGLLVMLIPSHFIMSKQKYNDVKRKIIAKAEIKEIFRLPENIFSNTEEGTDILVLQKK